MARVVASIEARMGSTRLPGKVLADVCGQPVIGRIVTRLKGCEQVDAIVIATSTANADDAIAEWAVDAGVPVYRGSEDDVLHRVVEAHRSMQSDVVVEVCGDTPLLDPHVIDMAIATFFANDCDVVSNTRHLSFPQGVDAQIFRRADLEEVEHTVKDPAVREHVSLFFYEHPERYRIVHLMAPPCWQGPQLRFQVDYREDLEFVRAIYGRLEPALGTAFATGDILELLRREPHLAEINSHCQEKPVR